MKILGLLLIILAMISITQAQDWQPIDFPPEPILGSFNMDEIMGYTSALLETNGFPGAYSDDNVLTHEIANGQTVVNIMKRTVNFIGTVDLGSNASMAILHNTSSGNPTQEEVNKIGETLWPIAKQVKVHFNQPDMHIRVGVNLGDLGPFGNKKAHFDRSEGV